MSKGQRTFSTKLAHSSKERGMTCPECGEKVQFIKHVNSVKSEQNDMWKFNKNMIAVCKCNQKEIYS